MVQLIKSFSIQSSHLHFPIRMGNPKVLLQLMLGGQVVREFDAELASGSPVDWWAFYDVSQFKGQTLSLVASGENLPESQSLWLKEAIQQGEGLMDASDLYHEKYRPQFHFTPRRGWNNDPNGMLYYQGEWHLYYQYNPFGTAWGNMHWGHAVSRDLLSWQELPIALYQKSLGDMAFSGGGVVDFNNTAGFKSGAEDPIVVSFTSTGRGECLAYSLDRGRSFTEYGGNPVLAHRGRDPKIIWYAPEEKWVMIVYDESLETTDGSVRSIGYAIYDSADLKHWTREDFLPGFYECPELFELPVSNRPGKKYWVVYGSTFQGYKSAFVAGAFDGRQFKPDMAPAQAHHGPNFYAAQIFSHAPGERRIMMGWLEGAAYPDMPFSQGMSVPLELSLRETSLGLRLCFNPAAELARLRTGEITGRELDMPAANRLLAKAPGELFDIQLSLQPASQAAIRLDVGGQSIVFDPLEHTLAFAGQIARLAPGPVALDLRVLIDRSVMEVFVNGGEAAFSTMTLFPEGRPEIALQGDVRVRSLAIHTLRSIWD